MTNVRIFFLYSFKFHYIYVSTIKDLILKNSSFSSLIIQINKKIKNQIMKVTVVGAGAVGASCAEYIAMKDFASEVVLVDIKEGFAEGKAMDLMQTASLNGFDTKITELQGIIPKQLVQK
jgi:malic enzyme